jgi:predicted nucleic acid-binding protein
MAKTEKVSVALEKGALARAKKAAAAEGLSLSGLLMKLLTAHFEREQRFESMGRFVEEFAPHVRVTERDMEAMRQEMNAPLKPIRDTGALVALERRKQRALQIWVTARQDRRDIVVPGAVIAEWWRARTDVREKIIAGLTVEPVDDRLGKAAGEAIAATPGATVVDAIVMALAARLGATVFTSDVDDLEELRAFYPGVRVLSV